MNRPCCSPNPRLLRVRGARTHNLRNLDLDIPKDALVVITGPSGSGKSSLAFDTLYAEGQRRYMESLSAYTRQFLQQLPKPDVDAIEGLSPAIAVEQKAVSPNPRSTVGTVTEIHDYLRLLWARVGVPHCPEHDVPLKAQTVPQMVDAVLAWPPETRVLLLAPLPAGNAAATLRALQGRGFVRVRLDGQVLETEAALARAEAAQRLEAVVDRLKVRPEARQRLHDSLEVALALSDGSALAVDLDRGHEQPLHARPVCPHCGYTAPELEPRLFSFNAPQGACPACNGLGIVEAFDVARVVAFPELSVAGGAIYGWDRRNPQTMALIQSLAAHYGFDPETPWQELPPAVREALLHGSGEEPIAFTYLSDRGQRVVQRHPFEGVLPNLQRRWQRTDSPAVREELARLRTRQPCPACQGARLRPEARAVFVGAGAQRRTLPQVEAMTLADALAWFEAVQLDGMQARIAAPLLAEIRSRLCFLHDVGLPYLTLNRRAETLSGGEAQRIRLASQIGSGLSGVLYVLDEPSIGLHPRDNDRLIATLQRLRDRGNTVIVVEHDEDMMRAADHLIDLGPGAGEHGGRLMAQGHWTEVAAQPDSPTGAFLSGRRRIAPPGPRRPWPGQAVLRLRGARGHNLRGVDVEVPIGLLTCVTGVSGSGKSTLVNDTLLRAVQRHLHGSGPAPEPFDALEGLEHFDKVIAVDQSPIGRTPRSNPATYTGVFTLIRELLAQTPAARERGWGPGRFSFNVPGGRCEACQGEGMVRVPMHFLPDVEAPCEVCGGTRFHRETLEVRYKGRHIAEMLDMTVDQAHAFFASVPALQRKLQTLQEVGLGYLRLGQSATTLSGGEAQRLKLAHELAKRDTGRTLYVLDEPTTGLHFVDIELLLKALLRLRDLGNTIVVIEHHLDVIRCADWVIDLGPEGGAGGGTVVACGAPEAIAAHPDSLTGRYLARALNPQQDEKPAPCRAARQLA
nr:excinuclease ABC subunit UvrA [Tepidimonas alkaliphilus]